MKKLFLISILVIASLCSYARMAHEPDTVQSRFFLLERLTGTKYMDVGHRNAGLYFIEEWTPGRIILESGEEINNLSLHYNGFQDQLLWLKDRTVQIILDKNIVSEFFLEKSGVSYHFKKYKIRIAKDNTDTYCQELYEGKVKLLVIRKCKLDSDAFNEEMLYYIYVPRPVYCVLIGDKIFFLKNARIRSIYNAFPGKKDSLRQRIRQQHLKVKNEKDFIATIHALEDILLL